MDPPIDDELLEKVRQLIESQMGYREVEFDQVQVPLQFFCIADLARQFGIGDDGTREGAMSFMPGEFVRSAALRVASLEPALSDWLLAGDWSPERNAISCLKAALEYRLSELDGAKPMAPAKAFQLSELEAILDKARVVPRKR